MRKYFYILEAECCFSKSPSVGAQWGKQHPLHLSPGWVSPWPLHTQAVGPRGLTSVKPVRAVSSKPRLLGNGRLSWPTEAPFSSIYSFLMTGKFPFLLSAVKFRCFDQPPLLFWSLAMMVEQEDHELTSSHKHTKMTNIYTKMTNIYRATTDNTYQNLRGKTLYDWR